VHAFVAFLRAQRRLGAAARAPAAGPGTEWTTSSSADGDVTSVDPSSVVRRCVLITILCGRGYPGPDDGPVSDVGTDGPTDRRTDGLVAGMPNCRLLYVWRASTDTQIMTAAATAVVVPNCDRPDQSAAATRIFITTFGRRLPRPFGGVLRH
jgi:hypothetical protein